MDPTGTERIRSPLRQPLTGGLDGASAEQLISWARLGMHVEAGLADMGRAVDVAAGRGQFAGLTPVERVLAHALIDARIAEGVAAAEFGNDETMTVEPSTNP